MNDGTEDLAADVRTIRFEIESIKRTQQLFLRRDANHILTNILLPIFEDKTNGQLASVYKYVDGQRSQAEIVEAMQNDGITISQSTVSRRMALLADHALIEEVELKGRGVAWRKNPEIERSLRLSQELMRRGLR